MIKKEILDKIIFLILTIDILVLPYFPIFAINTFFFLVFFSFLLKKPFVEKKISLIAFSFIFLACVSTIVSNIGSPYFLGENFKRLAQFFIIFIFYFYYFDFFKRNSAYDLVKYTSDVFFVSVLFWALLYVYKFNIFLKYKSIFNRNDGFTVFFEAGAIDIYRFSYIWTDPNNIVYAVLGLLVFSVINLRVTGLRKIAYFMITFFTCLLSMSTAGWLILFLFVVPIIVYYTSFKNAKNLVIILFSFVFIFYYILQFTPSLLNSDIVLSAINRYELNNFSTDSGLSRLDIWRNVFSYHENNIYKYFFIGDGYQLHNNGHPIKPHNGMLLILFAYGFPSLLLFMYFFFGFRIKKEFLFIIPFFLCFFVNVMIGETKLFLLYIYLLSYVRANEQVRA